MTTSNQDTQVDISSLSQLKQLAAKTAIHLRDGGVLLLKGKLGTGKTTLVQLFASTLHVPTSITSPTYTLLNTHYLSPTQKLHHLDLYRLEKVQEVEAIGIQELFLQKKDIIIIEWPELIENSVPSGSMVIQLTLKPDNSRHANIFTL